MSMLEVQPGKLYNPFEDALEFTQPSFPDIPGGGSFSILTRNIRFMGIDGLLTAEANTSNIDDPDIDTPMGKVRRIQEYDRGISTYTEAPIGLISEFTVRTAGDLEQLCNYYFKYNFSGAEYFTSASGEDPIDFLHELIQRDKSVRLVNTTMYNNLNKTRTVYLPQNLTTLSFVKFGIFREPFEQGMNSASPPQPGVLLPV